MSKKHRFAEVYYLWSGNYIMPATVKTQPLIAWVESKPRFMAKGADEREDEVREGYGVQ